MGSHNTGKHPKLHDAVFHVLHVLRVHVLIMSLCGKRNRGSALRQKISVSFQEVMLTYSKQLREARQKVQVQTHEETTSLSTLLYRSREKSLLSRGRCINMIIILVFYFKHTSGYSWPPTKSTRSLQLRNLTSK